MVGDESFSLRLPYSLLVETSVEPALIWAELRSEKSDSAGLLYFGSEISALFRP